MGFQSISKPVLARTNGHVATMVFDEWVIAGLAYAQVDTAGAWSPPDAGRPLCAPPSRGDQPSIEASSDGGFVVTWTKDDPDSRKTRLMAQRFDANDLRVWPDGGVAVIEFDTYDGPYPEGFAPASALGPRADVLALWGARTSPGSTLSTRLYYNHADENGGAGVTLPLISRLTDVLDDQGGRLEVERDSSPLDDGGNQISDYLIAKQLPDGALVPLDSLAAAGSSTYSRIVSGIHNLHESSAAPSVLRILARPMAGQSLWSPPDSAWAVDNLAPAVPTGLEVEQDAGFHRLIWRRAPEPDFGTFRLHQSRLPALPSGPFELAAVTQDTTLDVPGTSPQYFRLTCVDVNGNESSAATVQSDGTVTVDYTSAQVFRLDRPSPSPARDAFAIRWSQPSMDGARLTLHDIVGRQIAVLYDAIAGVGAHEVRFDARRSGSGPLPPGLYFVRLDVARQRAVQRVVLMP